MAETLEKKQSVDGFFMRLSDEEHRCWAELLKALRSGATPLKTELKEGVDGSRRAG